MFREKKILLVQTETSVSHIHTFKIIPFILVKFWTMITLEQNIKIKETLLGFPINGGVDTEILERRCLFCRLI